MEHKDFESPSFVKFREFHIELNHYIKLSIAAIDNLLESKADPQFEDKVNKLVRAAKEKWYGLRILNPVGELYNLRVQLTKTGVMWVYSAFDVFLNHVNSVCSQKEAEEFDESIVDTGIESMRLKTLYEKYSWSMDSISYLEIVYDYYSLARHSIVHNMGKASQELIKIAESKEFGYAMEYWPTVNPAGKLSPPPIIDEAGYMTLNPHHAITYSDVCYRISKDINHHLLTHLGVSHFVKRTVKNRILDTTSLEGIRCKDVYRYIRHYAKIDWKLDGIEDASLRTMLEELGIRRKVISKYKTLIANDRR